ncbi:MAG: hypothetical protein IJV31_03340, partial [Clostridia bacterium]|nr:hypothetical protein [Clostridia bacterium]
IIIKKDEDYVIRRLALSEYQVLSVLDEPRIEPLQDINIELFEGDNYIYLMDMTGNKFYAEYLVKNEFNETYVTYSNMNTAINETAKEIDLSVNQKLQKYSTTEETNALIQLLSNAINLQLEKKVDGEDLTGAYLMLLINGDTSEAKLSADKIGLSANDVLNLLAGNTINLTTKDLQIDSNNFKVDKNGNVTMKNATLTEGKIDSDNFKVDKNGNVIMKNAYMENISIKSMAAQDYSFSFSSDGKVYANSIGIKGDTANSTVFVIDNYEDNNEVGVTSKYLFLRNRDGYTNVSLSNNGTSGHIYCRGGIEATSYVNNSKKELKENIYKLERNSKSKMIKRSAIEILKGTDICEYNFKGQEHTQVGVVIGDTYNAPTEILTEDKKGVDLYSMISLSWKAIQEQQELIENLIEKDKQKDEMIEKISKRLEALENG